VLRPRTELSKPRLRLPITGSVIELLDDDPVQCGIEFCVICKIDTKECLQDDVIQHVTSGSVVKVHQSCSRKFFYDNHGLKHCSCRLPIVVNDCILVVTLSVVMSFVICVEKL